MTLNNRKKYAPVILFLCVLLMGACKEESLGTFIPQDPELSFTAPTINVSKTEGTYEFGITSNLPWRIKSDVSWITFTTSSGLKDGSFSFKTEKNNTTSARSATLTAWITEDYQKQIIVTQEAGDPAPDTSKHLYVKTNGTGDGTSWSKATNLTTALSMNLYDGDVIHIAAGTYVPGTAVTGGTSGSADFTFEIRNNISLIGGYPANASDGATADPKTNSTILSGDLGSGNVNHVVAVTALPVTNKKVLLRGLTIKSGNAAGTDNVLINGINYPRNFGGGIIIAQSTVELADCIISDNKSSAHAAGIYIFSSASVTISRCEVKSNVGTTITSNAGGIFINGATAYINHTSITGNIAGGVGGGIQTLGSSKLFMYNSTIANNKSGSLGTAGRAAGGIYHRNNSVGQLVNCTIFGNSGTGNGGGICTHDKAVLDIISSTISGNSSLTGGGIFNTSGCTVNLHNSIVSNNEGTIRDISGVLLKKQTIVADKVYDQDETEVAGALFNASTMLGDLADNGGYTKTCKLIGSDNPAITLGMSNTGLSILGASLNPVVKEEIIGFDQRGKNRSGKKCIGAYVIE